MKEKLHTTLAYITEHKQALGTGVIGLIGVVVLVSLFIYNQPVTYTAASACDLLTPSKAMNALGDKVIQTGNTSPVTSGDVATSRCGYTDQNTDKEQMVEASIAVQSAVNDDGIAQNTSDFKQHKSALSDKAEVVNNLGTSAYFDTSTNQLNILTDKDWIKLSYGTGTGPVSKPLADIVALAHTVLQ